MRLHHLIKAAWPKRKGPKRVPKPTTPDRAERIYLGAARLWAAEFRRAVLEALADQGIRFDGPDTVRVELALGAARLKIAQGTEQLPLKGIASEVDRHVTTYTGRVLGIPNSAVAKPTDLAAWQKANRDLITRTSEQGLARVAATLKATDGMRVEDIAKNLQGALGWTEKHARLVARDQTLKLCAQINRDQQKAAGIDRYIWRTSEDGSVRESHAELNGKTFSWDDPPEVDEKTGRCEHPGGDYQCRCTAEPVVDELADLNDLDSEEPDWPAEQMPEPEAEPDLLANILAGLAKPKKAKPAAKSTKPAKVVLKPTPKPPKPPKPAKPPPAPKPAKPPSVPKPPKPPKPVKLAVPEDNDTNLPEVGRKAVQSEVATRQFTEAKRVLERLPTEQKAAFKAYSFGSDTTIIQHQMGMSDEQNLEGYIKSRWGYAAKTDAEKASRLAAAKKHLAEAKVHSAQLLQAIDSPAVPNFEGTIYRGLHDLQPAAINRLVSGKPIDLARGAGVLSTSSNPVVAFDFASNGQHATRQGVILEIRRTRSKGVGMREVSELHDEDEVLMRGGGQFKAVEVHRLFSNMLHIVMQEI